LGVLVAADAAAGSLCLPQGSSGKVYLSDQQGIIFYQKPREQIVLRVDYEIRDPAAPITKLGWIIPVPGKPDLTSTASSEVFPELNDFTVAVFADESKEPPARGGELPEQTPRTQPAIEALKGSGKGAALAANQWLQRHGLQVIRPDEMSYYAQHSWCFVAVLFEDAQGLPPRGRLGPVRLSFAAQRIYYPLLLCADEGVFDFTLYIFSKGSIDRSELNKFGLTLAELEAPGMKQTNRITRVRDLPEQTRRLFDLVAHDEPAISKLERGRIFLYRTCARGLNDDDHPIAKWDTDLELSAPVGSPLSPYINIMVGIAAVLTVFAVARTRQRIARDRARS
jgi:hypothetical protein